ncbi:hypothetical protein ACCO45_007510 [Purpureocillium lilacinum]|uniref:Uncharacterized protein n=1 Tax=Purpureocillium lilacinum TaxID=33203 RepID=A0ACC4DVM4_PURLI
MPGPPVSIRQCQFSRCGRAFSREAGARGAAMLRRHADAEGRMHRSTEPSCRPSASAHRAKNAHPFALARAQELPVQSSRAQLTSRPRESIRARLWFAPAPPPGQRPRLWASVPYGASTQALHMPVTGHASFRIGLPAILRSALVGSQTVAATSGSPPALDIRLAAGPDLMHRPMSLARSLPPWLGWLSQHSTARYGAMATTRSLEKHVPELPASGVSAYSCPRRAIQSFALSRHLAPATTQLPSPCKRRRATPERTRWHQRAATTATTTTTAASSISGTHGLDRSAFHLISLNLIPLQHRQRRSAIDRAAPP